MAHFVAYECILLTIYNNQMKSKQIQRNVGKIGVPKLNSHTVWYLFLLCRWFFLQIHSFRCHHLRLWSFYNHFRRVPLAQIHEISKLWYYHHASSANGKHCSDQHVHKIIYRSRLCRSCSMLMLNTVRARISLFRTRLWLALLNFFIFLLKAHLT